MFKGLVLRLEGLGSEGVLGVWRVLGVGLFGFSYFLGFGGFFGFGRDVFVLCTGREGKEGGKGEGSEWRKGISQAEKRLGRGMGGFGCMGRFERWGFGWTKMPGMGFLGDWAERKAEGRGGKGKWEEGGRRKGMEVFKVHTTFQSRFPCTFTTM